MRVIRPTIGVRVGVVAGLAGAGVAGGLVTVGGGVAVAGGGRMGVGEAAEDAAAPAGAAATVRGGLGTGGGGVPGAS